MPNNPALLTAVMEINKLVTLLPDLTPLDNDGKLVFGIRKYDVRLTDEQWIALADALGESPQVIPIWERSS